MEWVTCDITLVEQALLSYNFIYVIKKNSYPKIFVLNAFEHLWMDFQAIPGDLSVERVQSA